MIHRPSIIAPRCPKCGGFTREWQRANRRRAGFASWLHGACICCGCPPDGDSFWDSTFTVDIVGVDAAKCGTGCYPNPTVNFCNGSGFSNIIGGSSLEVAVDGSYSFPFTTLSELLNGNCTLWHITPADSQYAAVGFRFGDCSNHVTGSHAFWRLLVLVQFTNRQTIRRVVVRPKSNKIDDDSTFCGTIATFDSLDGEWSFGDEIPNGLICSSSGLDPNPGISSGGHVVVGAS